MSVEDTRTANDDAGCSRGHQVRVRFDIAWRALEAQLDPGTTRHLPQALGVGEGWHCLKVGGGGGSITEWRLSPGEASWARRRDGH
jgi:ubiquinone/menaquinone biosynthesis C-methylase UbiE